MIITDPLGGLSEDVVFSMMDTLIQTDNVDVENCSDEVLYTYQRNAVSHLLFAKVFFDGDSEEFEAEFRRLSETT